MKHISYILVFWTLCLISYASANGQKLSGSKLKAFLEAATEKTSEYSNVFKNLSAEEIKTFEIGKSRIAGFLCWRAFFTRYF